jgi:serine protease
LQSRTALRRRRLRDDFRRWNSGLRLNIPRLQIWLRSVGRLPNYSCVLRAWTRFPSRGKGILIGQPDTGIAEHQEVDRAALDLDRAADILDGDKDPTDPLIPGTANPGHGTGTASVVISREAGVMVGSAPEATLVPIRCTTDVKIFDGTPVAAAIEHATRVRCDVITMSLGGPPSLAV